MIFCLIRNFCLISICFVLSGCFIKSLNPFYTKETLVEFFEINGCWQPLDLENEIVKYCFDDTTFSFKGQDEESFFNVHYFMVKESVYMDVTASFDEVEDLENFKEHIAPIHTLYKIQKNSDQLHIIPLDRHWFYEKNEKREISFFSVVVDDSLEEYYINHSSDWIAFLEKWDSDRSFDPEMGLVLVRCENDSEE